ncbi:N-formylglutamate amidohydrolase [Catellatospora tritici]|uniref:N-formylglutamate amidohydrolase n=1 Tax=Catellatospora tritici TaxID=2851566 RepID=UPI001C2D5B22|nr:N-formylglutamate amidohydrolase [Catellatospora tritici]MBV1851795.1 N-formylglutamate amidohydrolase [Catellatospora tritici]
MNDTEPGHRVLPGGDASPVILHVPHAAIAIPADVRAGLLLDDVELAAELAAMTDAHTDLIAAYAADAARLRPWSLVNGLSRLVVDPERFPDEREPMIAVGMGAVYTRTSAGAPLRADDPAAAKALVERWFDPYAAAMTELVDARLAATGRAVIIDVHSYPRERLPYEIGGVERPEVCLGTDSAHTPPWLVEAARSAFADYDAAFDSPFAGCYVPLKHHGKDTRVHGLMIELRRDGYSVEPGGPPTEGLAAVGAALARLVDACAALA